jgi:hypothetical protein
MCAGELAGYVKEELNVSELKTADPDEYGTMKVRCSSRITRCSWQCCVIGMKCGM